MDEAVQRFRRQASGSWGIAMVSNNTVTSGYDLLSIGLMVGDHPWNEDLNLSHAGEISGNTISGAVTLMWIEGIVDSPAEGTILNNSLSNRQGTAQIKAFSCTETDEYAAYHYGNATIQSGWVSRRFDNQVCY